MHCVKMWLYLHDLHLYTLHLQVQNLHIDRWQKLCFASDKRIGILDLVGNVCKASSEKINLSLARGIYFLESDYQVLLSMLGYAAH